VASIVERRASWTVVVTVSSVLLAVAGGCHGSGAQPGCPDAAPCPSANVPVVLVLTCDGEDVVQTTFTGPCAGQTLACQEPADASSIVGCTTASFASPSPGTCGLQLTFANGFVFTQSFTFAEQPGACPSCGPQLVPSPEIVPVFCAPDGGADAEVADAAAEAAMDVAAPDATPANDATVEAAVDASTDASGVDAPGE
jgi:hypothetical protein